MGGNISSTITELTSGTNTKYHDDDDDEYGRRYRVVEALDPEALKNDPNRKNVAPEWGWNSKSHQRQTPNTAELMAHKWGAINQFEEEDGKPEKKQRKSIAQMQKAREQRMLDLGLVKECKRCASKVQAAEVGTYTSCPVLGQEIEIEDLKLCVLLHPVVAEEMERSMKAGEMDKEERKRLKREARLKRRSKIQAQIEEQQKKIADQVVEGRSDSEDEQEVASRLAALDLEGEKSNLEDGWSKPEPPSIKRVNAHSISLEWDAMHVGGKRASSYVLLGRQLAGTPAFKKFYSGPGRRYKVSAFPGMEYEFKIFGRTAEADSLESDILPVTTPTLAGSNPGSPTRSLPSDSPFKIIKVGSSSGGDSPGGGMGGRASPGEASRAGSSETASPSQLKAPGAYSSIQEELAALEARAAELDAVIGQNQNTLSTVEENSTDKSADAAAAMAAATAAGVASGFQMRGQDYPMRSGHSSPSHEEVRTGNLYIDTGAAGLGYSTAALNNDNVYSHSHGTPLSSLHVDPNTSVDMHLQMLQYDGFTSLTIDQEQDLRLSPQQHASTMGSMDSSFLSSNPTEPVRVAQLDSGWIECFDPTSQRMYYYNPRTDVSQWERPSEEQADPSVSATQTPHAVSSSATPSASSSPSRDRVSPARFEEHARNAQRNQDGTLRKDAAANFRMKRMRFLWSIRDPGPRDGRRFQVKVRRGEHTLLHDSFRAFHRKDVEELSLKTKVTFEGESGIDSGGLSQEWYFLVSKALLQQDICLFKREQGETYHINPNSSLNDDHLSYFYFTGQIMAKAILDRKMIGIHLSKAILKIIIGLPMVLKDLEASDPIYYKSLIWMVENDITGVIDETFTIMESQFGAEKVVELLPGGKDIPVTDSNKKSYVAAVVRYKLYGSIRQQVTSLVKGFHSLVPVHKVADFTAEELQKIFTGRDRIDAKVIQRCCRYQGGYDEHSPPVQMFWLAFRKMRMEERSEVLSFVTGSSRMPLDGFDPQFTITRDSSTPLSGLPSAHTCFNQLVLPPYESQSSLEEKLNRALKEAVGFHLT